MDVFPALQPTVVAVGTALPKGVRRSFDFVSECDVIYEAVPVKKPRTCVLPVACPPQPLPKFGIVQVLCQSAHGQRVVSLVVFEVVCIPPAIAVAAFLSGIPDRSPSVVHSFFLSGTLKHSIGGRSTG